MILMMHHIVCDWASIGNFWRDLSALYHAGCRGQPLELPALPIQHGDYAVWHRQLLNRGDFAQDLAYWQETLRGAPRCWTFRQIGLVLLFFPIEARSDASRSRRHWC